MKGYRLIEISADSCTGCHALLQGARAAAEKFGLEFVFIDAEGHEEEIMRYGVEKIPTVLLCDGDEIFAKCTGYQPQEILELWIEAKIESYRNTKEQK